VGNAVRGAGNACVGSARNAAWCSTNGGVVGRKCLVVGLTAVRKSNNSLVPSVRLRKEVCWVAACVCGGVWW